MKNLIIATLLSLAFVSNAQFLPKDKIMNILEQGNPVNSPLDNLGTLYKSLGDYFGIDFSDQISCYDDDSALIKLKLPAALEGFSYLYLQGNQALAKPAALALQKLVQAIEGAINCQYSTPSYSAFMQKIGLSGNVTKSKEQLKFYYLGEMAWDYEARLPIVAELAKGEYAQAGKDLGAVYEAIGKNASDSRLHRNVVSAFHYGAFYAMNISSPLQFWDCFNNEAKEKNYTLMITGWANAVANSSPTTANEATGKWFQETGNALVQSIEDQVKCEINTDDQKRYNTAIGYDVHSEEFKKMIAEWCKDNQAEYYYLMKTMNEYAIKEEPQTVGFVYSLFMNKVAKSQKITEREILGLTQIRI